jgi:uncharacterized protein (DUF58 family)
MEGFIAGMHRSPYRGFSVEFASHREYCAGDDIKYLDWKVYGRSDRLYVKEFELETNLRSHILLDTSESMDYGSSDITKLELACFVAASMAYMIINQQDAVSLITFDKDVKKHLPSSNSMGHMKTILAELAETKPQEKTNIGVVLHQVAEGVRRRGMVIVISDFFDELKNILRGIEHLRYKGHDVILFHILDEYELKFPFQRLTLFDGYEEMPKIVVDPRTIRRAYLEEINQFCNQIKKMCLQVKADYFQITTDVPLEISLTKYLVKRLATKITGR